jgi:UDP-N-acetylglucosamine 3-dehydrogenase
MVLDRIKCGIIGLGWFGEHHIDALKALPLADVSAVCTRREARLKEVASKYDIPEYYTNYHDLLDNDDIDMVSVVTHVKDHKDITIDALKAGKHVFLEKPMADNVTECDQIIKEVEKTEKNFMVGHICRFGSDYAIAKEEIESGKIGEILSIHAKRNLAKWITESHLHKISALFGDGVHDMDIALWYMKSKPVSVYAQTRKIQQSVKYDDLGWAMFRMKNGAFVVIENIWCLPDNVPFAIGAVMEIVGTKGTISIDCTGSNFKLLTEKGLQYPPAAIWPKIHGVRRGWLREEFDYFLKCIIDNVKPSIITPLESRDVVHAIRTAEKSAQENRVINF